MTAPGATNSLLDVGGLRIGHATRRGEGWLTGSTVVLAGPGGAVCGVDVRGGGPGTRETDLLDPRNAVERVHAVVLSGGSAFGLAAADGVMEALEADGRGFPAAPGMLVPIVPAAVIYDLGRGGSVANRPDRHTGKEAYDDALASSGRVPAQGNVGVGTGAVTGALTGPGALKGGIGTASEVLDDGTTVAALVVVNAAGSTVDPLTGELYGARHGLDEEFARLRAPSEEERAAARTGVRHPRGSTGAPKGDGRRTGLATTLAVVGTDATLPKALCAKVAGMGHDGMARAIHPVHTMYDGDTVFALATGERATPGPAQLHAMLCAAGDCVTRAVVHAMLTAGTVTTEAGRWRCYRDVFPSAVAAWRT